MTRLWHAGLWGALQQVLKRKANSSDTGMKAEKVMDTVGEVDREVGWPKSFSCMIFISFKSCYGTTIDNERD